MGDFEALCESLVGTWAGHRRTGALEHEAVRSRWQKALDGRFLQEDWQTGGPTDHLSPTAVAYFAVAGGPGDFVAVYTRGKIAFGESTFADGEWRLTHRWLREPGVAVIRLRLVDADTYEQEVLEVMPDGRLEVESRAVLRRE